jgi:ABC-type branched-subunit amino acid transport system substrate-binding protein/mono/diheme cytochrome c family protein
MRRAFAAAIVLITTSLIAAPKLTQQEARGKQIYLHGESPNGKPITALMGGEGVEVPATIVPCASCHGADARGKSEGGVRPSNLRWDVLTKPYAAAGERTHPPYTRTSIKRAITMGVDPASNKLQPAMPRYRMSLAQMDDLIAYLQKLPQDSDPGLTDDAVRIGVITSTPAARIPVESYIARINRAGGIFGRKIELRFTSALTQTFIDTDQPFALAASSLIGNEEESESRVDRNQLPTIAAIAIRTPKSRYSFHLLAGIREQTIALAQYAIKRGATRTVIVSPDEQPWRDIAAEVIAETRLPGCQVAELPTCVASTISATGQPGNPATSFIVLGPASLQRELLRSSNALILIPGAIAASLDDLPANLDHRAAIAVPLIPSDATPTGLAELHALGTNSTSPSITGTFVSLQLLIESLRRAGRDLGREKLIDTMEGLYDLESGLTPKITFGPNRHTGTNIAHILVWSGKEKTFVVEDSAPERH